MTTELAVERLRFSCPGCEHEWETDYDVQRAEDHNGHIWEYFSLNGVPVTAPTAPGSVSCERCGASWVHVHLVGLREIPLADPNQVTAAQPRQTADPARRTNQDVPLLRGDEQAADAGASRERKT